MKNISIIDGPCGSGKTEYIIQQMNAHPEQPYLYISPLRAMFDRIAGKGEYVGRGATAVFHTPGNRNSDGTKLRDFKQLVEVGANIMSTHALFLRLDAEAVQLISDRNYHLIIDEALDTVAVLPIGKNKDCESEETVFQNLKTIITHDDITQLLEEKYIEIDSNDFNRLKWIGNSYEGTRNYSVLEPIKDLERIIKAGGLSYVNGTFLLWNFPISALDAFENITVLTYRFRNSILQGYLKFFDKSYTHYSIIQNDGTYKLVGFSPEIESGNAYRQFINIFYVDSLNAIGVKPPHGKFPLSLSWYSNKDNITKLKTLSNNTTNFFRNYCEASRDSVMWTSFKKYKKKVSPKGYVELPNGGETYVYNTCRATEEYKDRYNLAYLVDKHLNPGVEAFFAQKNITIDKDNYSLSELIQWLFRSRLRNTRSDDRSINLYIPSQRMRGLLEGWLDCEPQLRKDLKKAP